MTSKEMPFSVGDTVIGQCEVIGNGGDGIFKFKGYVVIVKGAKVNETYNLRIEKVFKNFAFASILKE